MEHASAPHAPRDAGLVCHSSSGGRRLPRRHAAALWRGTSAREFRTARHRLLCTGRIEPRDGVPTSRPGARALSRLRRDRSCRAQARRKPAGAPKRGRVRHTGCPRTEPGVRVGLIVECAATFVCEEVAALRSLGVEVALASAFRPGPGWGAAFGDEVAYPRAGRGAWAARALHDGFRSGPRLADLVRCALAERAPLRLVALAANLARRARRERWQHVHASFATYPAWLAWATAHLARLPFSFTAHAYDVQEPRPWLARVAREAAFVRAISIETAARVHAAAGSAARVRVGYLGVDVERFRPGDDRADPPEILTVARLVPKKGIEVLIEAVRLLTRGEGAREGAARFRVHLLGDGPLHAACAARSRALGLHEVIFFHGAATPAQVALALQRATIFALPCVLAEGGTQHDGLPVALLEAMASGLPAVSTPVGGIPEALTDGENGVLVPPSDAHALAAALAMLLGDAGLCRRLGASARERVLRQFRGDAAAARLAAWMADARPSSSKKVPAGTCQWQAEAEA
ncbi:MAG TPA: hypothetical protein DEP35_02405 [Deltaproteobacteria bacterium]|nr:hypothetical protein [Deltaproteobacteria bacterium]